MREPSFCSSCGEKILKQSRMRWTGSALCSKCSPQFKRKRLIITWVTIGIVAASFLVGRYTAPRKPFYFIGAPADQSTIVHQSNRSGGDSQALASSPPEVSKPAETVEAICGAKTKAGKTCQRKVRAGGRCWQHRDESKAQVTATH